MYLYLYNIHVIVLKLYVFQIKSVVSFIIEINPIYFTIHFDFLDNSRLKSIMSSLGVNTFFNML